MKIKIALPKGRFHNKSLEIIQKHVGQGAFLKDSKKLVFESANVVFFLLKASDICSLIFAKNVDFGLVPDEWILENEFKLKTNFNRLGNVNWVNTRLSLISDFKKNILKKHRIVSSYPHITHKYLLEKGIKCNIDDTICKLNGSIEAMVPRIFSFGVECVESGETLGCNGLQEVDVIHRDLSLSFIKHEDCRLDPKLLSKFLSYNYNNDSK